MKKNWEELEFSIMIREYNSKEYRTTYRVGQTQIVQEKAVRWEEPRNITVSRALIDPCMLRILTQEEINRGELMKPN